MSDNSITNIYDCPLAILNEKHIISPRLYGSLLRGSKKVYEKYENCELKNITLRQVLNTYTLDELRHFRQMGDARFKELTDLIANNNMDEIFGSPELISLYTISASINAIKVSPDTSWAELYKKVARILNTEFEKHGIDLIEEYGEEEEE